jgi:hypothetical protein
VIPVRYKLNVHMYICYVEETSVVKWSEILATEQRCTVFPVRYELNLYMVYRKK